MRVSLTEASDILMESQVVAIPTETVYGLAASLSYCEAIDQIFTLKKRPNDNPLIIHLYDANQVCYFTQKLPENFELLAEAFWPGPLTLVMPINPELVPMNVRAGLPTGAFRVPNHPLTLEVLNRVGPLVMPSANLSGRPSATRREHVEADFGDDFPVLDGGFCGHGVESTILYLSDGKWQITRLGAISAEEFAPVLGYVPELKLTPPGEVPICPGQIYQHYSPRANLQLEPKTPPVDAQAIVGFSDRDYPSNFRLFTMGPSTDPVKVAENLYAVLRKLDRDQIQTAWVDMDFPRQGLWATVAERLFKAEG